jgi:D-amino-acid oxidase
VYDMVVVGAGIIGLTSALRAQEAGARVAVVTADPPERTTSSVAAAVWYPTGIRDGAPELEWARRTYQELASQAGGGVPGVTMRPARMLLRSAAATVPWWAAAVPDLGPLTVSAPFAGGWGFTAPTVEMAVYLPWLCGQVGSGGVFRRLRISHLAEVAGLAPIVINATGLAARALCRDAAVRPVRGQLTIVSNPGLGCSVRDVDNPGGYTYVHPRTHDVVLGGSFEVGRWDTTPDPDIGRAIVRRCTELVPELVGARIIGHRVGLRPVREPRIRLEIDPVGLPGGARLVHNYGHGGAGVSLAWGCADAVTELALGHPAR